jgi:uncharacterized protein (DUF433 family)
MKQPTYNPFELPNYDLVSAARYLHLPDSTLHFWVSGKEPIVRLRRYGRFPLLSFKNLVECYVVQGIRTINDVHVSKIRTAAAWMRKHLNATHPLADYDLTTDGTDLYLEIDGNLINLSMRRHQGQQEIRELLLAHLQRVERDTRGMALRLIPYDTKGDMKAPGSARRSIVIDPKVSFGKPILRESGIPTAVLAGRYRAGDSIRTLARSYGREEGEIRQAVEWEIGRAA